MENYHKAESHKYSTAPEPHEIRIGQRHRIKEVISKALRYLEDESKRQVLLAGQGPSVTKTVTCCEIVKRKVPTAYQNTKICYTTIEDIWEPNDAGLELDKLKVTTQVPAVHILLSHAPLDSTSAGYQPPTQVASRKKRCPAPVDGRRRWSRRSEGDRRVSLSEEKGDGAKQKDGDEDRTATKPTPQKSPRPRPSRKKT